LLKQINQLSNKFPDYKSFADATIGDMFDQKTLDKALKLTTYNLESCWIENKAGELILKRLPDQVQFSCVNAFINYDFDGNGKQEIIAAGNFYPFNPQIGMSDASVGTMLEFSNDSLRTSESLISPLRLYGDIRDMSILSFKNGRKMVVVSKYNDNPGIYKINPGFVIKPKAE
jgi:hypothetical protein